MMRPRFLAASLLLVVALTWATVAGAQPGPGSLRAAVAAYEALVLAHNPGLLDIERQAAELRSDLASPLLLDEGSLSLSSTYPLGSSAGVNPGAASGAAGISLPIVPGLALGAQVASSGASSLTLSLQPFAGIAADLSQTQLLEQLELSASTLRSTLAQQARAGWLSFAAARHAATLADDAFALAQREFAELEAAVAAGVRSVTELTAAADLVATRATSLANARSARDDALADLLEHAGQPALPPAILTPVVRIDALRALIADADARLATAQAEGVFSSAARQQLALQARHLDEELRTTWDFVPAMTLAVSATNPDLFGGGAPEASVTLAIQLSAANVNVDARRDLRRQLDDTTRAIAVADAVLALERHNALRAIEAARLAAEVTDRTLAAAEKAARQAQADLADGKISALTSENAQLASREAEASLISSLVALYAHVDAAVQAYRIDDPSGGMP